MHIPEGYLSPKTYVPAYLLILPLFKIAWGKAKTKFDDEALPLLSSITALSFVIMMFNIPIPGGTSGHAIGAAVISILFGPWIGSLAISLVLIIQALVFGDGGITSFPVNALAMGFTASFVSYYIYHILKNKINKSTALFFSGWTGIVAASVVIAFFLGVQPLVASDSLGRPLFFPFGFSITFPALVGAHVLFFGIVEGIYTVIAIKVIERNFNFGGSSINYYSSVKSSKKQKIKFGIFLLFLILLVPIGLLTDAPAWGEWSLEHFKTLIGFIPKGMQKFSMIYKAPIPDYSVLGLNSSLGYYISAIVGVTALIFIYYLILKLLKLNKKKSEIFLFITYVCIIILLTVQSNIYSIIIVFLLLALFSGSSFIKLFKRTIIALLMFNLIVSISFIALSLYNGTHPFYSMLLINLRTMTLTFATFWIIEKVNLFNIFSFSKSMTFLLTLSYTQIISFKKILNEFRLALKSRSIKKPSNTNLIQFLSSLTLFFLNSALNNSKEILMAMKSRGFHT